MGVTIVSKIASPPGQTTVSVGTSYFDLELNYVETLLDPNGDGSTEIDSYLDAQNVVASTSMTKDGAALQYTHTAQLVNDYPELEIGSILNFTKAEAYDTSTTEIAYGRIYHKFAAVPPGNVIVEGSKMGNMFIVHNTTASAVVLEGANGSTKFNGASTYSIAAGKLALFMGDQTFKAQVIGS